MQFYFYKPKNTYVNKILDCLIVLGFNDMSTLVDHFVSSPREREKRDRRDSRRDSRGDEREGQGRKRNSPLYPYLQQV